jgi:hypothetical protein
MSRRTRSARPVRPSRPCRPSLEQLEGRDLPSVSIGYFHVPGKGLQGAALAFSAQATDTSGSALTYSWTFMNVPFSFPWFPSVRRASPGRTKRTRGRGGRPRPRPRRPRWKPSSRRSQGR